MIVSFILEKHIRSIVVDKHVTLVPDYANVLVKVVAIFGLINRVPSTKPAHNVFFSAVAHIFTPPINWLSGLNRASKINVGLEPGSGPGRVQAYE